MIACLIYGRGNAALFSTYYQAHTSRLAALKDMRLLDNYAAKNMIEYPARELALSA